MKKIAARGAAKPRPPPKFQKTANPNTRPPSSQSAGVASIIIRLKKELASRGAKGMVGLGRKFRIMDDDGSKSLNMSEFKKAMIEMNMGLTDKEIRALFTSFDGDHSGSINYEEFVQGVRDPLSDRRRALVDMAFAKLDKDGSGTIDPEEISSCYDASKHPEVIEGRKTPEEVFMEFMETFEVGSDDKGDGKVTLKEFQDYYTNVGANIPDDDYFELMIRNAWHIPWRGGLVRQLGEQARAGDRPGDGRQTVEEIKYDLGLKADDKEGMLKRLQKQGINAAAISTFDEAGDEDGGQAPKPGASAPARVIAPARKAQSLRAAASNKGAPDAGMVTPTKKKKPRSPTKRPKVVDTPQTPSGAVPDAGNAMLVKQIKAALASRGARGFIGLQRKFRIMDDDGSKSLDLGEFKKGLKESGFSDIPDQDLRRLFECFDADGNGTVDFEEFIQVCFCGVL